jgi:hypothetical protein
MLPYLKTFHGAILVVLLVLATLMKECKAQFPTASPTLPCPSEFSAWAQCLVGQGLDVTAAQACAQCATAWSTSIDSTTTCGELTTLVCDAIDSCASVCGGGSCDSAFVDWTSCVFNGSQECFPGCSSPTSPTDSAAPVSAPTSGGTTTAPAAAPSPTSSGTPCPDETAALAACIQSTGSLQECVACVGSAQVNCDENEEIVCGLEANCPSCGSCLEEQIAANDCLNAGVCDPISCVPTATTPSTPSPAAVSPAPAGAPSPTASSECDELGEAYASCLVSAGTLESCTSCGQEYFPGGDATSVGCDDLIKVQCGLSQACPACASCQDEQIAAASCLNFDVCGAFTCNDGTPVASPTANGGTTPAPASGPTGPTIGGIGDSPTRAPSSSGNPPNPFQPTSAGTLWAVPGGIFGLTSVLATAVGVAFI